MLPSHRKKTPMCRVLLADFIYHPNCGWSESLVGGKGLIDWAKFAHSYLRIFLVKLSIIAYNKTLRSWVIFFYELPFGRGETHYHRFNWHAVPYFIQQMDAAAKRLVIRLLPQHPGSFGKMQCCLNPRMLLGGHPETKTCNIRSHLYNNFLIIPIKTYCRDIKVHSEFLSLTIYKR